MKMETKMKMKLTGCCTQAWHLDLCWVSGVSWAFYLSTEDGGTNTVISWMAASIDSDAL